MRQKKYIYTNTCSYIEIKINLFKINNMDEEEITWNLKGPKRMRKRRELNALLKNNLKYKSLLMKNQNNNNNNSIDMDQTHNLNDSSSENDEFYFSGNKSFIRKY